MDQNPTKETRSPVNLRIKFRSESLEQFIDRYAIDVSRGGIFIRTREPLVVGTQLKLDFQYQSGAPLMSGEGTVVWIRDPDPNRANVPPGMGVRFDRLTPESQVVLEQLLADKAAKEKSGVSPVANERSGGMAVRRPSSMFAALEADQLSALPTAPPSSSTAASPPGPGAAAFPGRPSAAYIPTVSAVPPASPVKSATVLPASGPPPQPRATSAGLSTLAGGKAGVSPPAVKPPVSPPATGGSAPPADPAASASVYRPLGTARNPFSSPKPGAAPTGNQPVQGARMTSTLAAVMDKAGGPSRDDTATPSGGVLITDSDVTNQTDVGDELTDEPTQIAGRMPSFLGSDEDPTSVGARPTGSTSDIGLPGINLHDEPTRITNRDIAAPGRSSESTLRSVGGARGVNRATAGGEPARAKQSLDLGAPVGSAPPMPVVGEKDLRITSVPVGNAAGSGSQGNRLPSSDKLAALDPLAVLDAMASGQTKAPSATPTPTPAPTAEPVASSVAALLTPAPAVAAPATAATAPKRRASGMLIGLTVVGLGAAAFFVFRFFAAQSTQPPTGPAIAVTVGPADPVPAPAPKPEVEAPAAPTPPPKAAPTAAEGTTKAAPTAAEGNPPAPGSGSATPEPAPAAAAAPAPTPPVAAAAPVKVTPPTPAPSKTVAVAETAPAHKTVKRKTPRSGGSSPAADVAAAPEPAEKPAPAEPKALPSEVPSPAEPAATAAATAGTAPAEPSAAAGHQIRVTSKPSGADVAIDGQVVGQTPLGTSIADVSSPHFLSVRKEGFEPFEQMISASSAWTKGRAAKGQAAVPTLKINAKLKSSGGGAGDGETAAGKEGSPPKVDEGKADKTMGPGGTDERAPIVAP